jgi:hypothetical protein
MPSLDTACLEEIGNVIFGKQQELNEVTRVLENLPVNHIEKSEIQKLKLGQFFVVARGKVTKVFARPIWMDLPDAVECALNPNYVYKILEKRKKDSS